MKFKIFLLFALLAVSSYANAQEINQNPFASKRVTNFFSSKSTKERVNPNFPTPMDNANGQLPQNSAYVRPDAKTRRKRYLNTAFGISALINAGATAALKQVINSPSEWHRTSAGFGKRFASEYAQGAISKTITYGINETFKLDDHFQKSKLTGFGKRVKYVLINSLATHTEKGKYIPDFPFFIGTYSANIIAKETWYPKGYDYRDGLVGGTTSILTRLGLNFVKEFFHK